MVGQYDVGLSVTTRRMREARIPRLAGQSGIAGFGVREPP